MVYTCKCIVCKELRKLYGRGFEPSDVEVIRELITNRLQEKKAQEGPSLSFVFPTIQEPTEEPS